MNRLPTFDILDVNISATNMADAVSFLDNLIQRKQKGYVCVCPVSTIMACQEDSRVLNAVNQADLATPDGMPTVWIGKSQGFKNIERVYGPDLFLEMCRLAEEKGYKTYFYGSAPEVLERLEKRLKIMYPNLLVCGRYAPPYRDLSEDERQKIIEDINACSPDMLWVGLGSPKQDLWMAENRAALKVPVMAGVGAAFDFVAGTKKQAPDWMQRSGLEWVFRLFTEPRRLWRRYLIGNTLFLLLLFKRSVLKIR